MDVVYLLGLLMVLDVAASARQCMDKDGRPVDWFIVYKLPKIKGDSHPFVGDGLGSFYMDINHPHWVLSEVSINATNHAVGYTLAPLYGSQSESSMHVVYNDETPEKKEGADYGHTKGVVSFDEKTGFWLVHSVPRFPPYTNMSYSYPESGTHYGQSFLCLSLGYASLETIGQLFMYNYPQIYDQNMPPSFKESSPTMAKVVEGQHQKKGPYNKTEPLTTLGGTTFQAFAKFSKYEQELYSDWIAPYYKTDLLTETWQNGRGKLPSECNAKYTVENIQSVEVMGVKVKEQFDETTDHSKWAVSSKEPLTCIGDINRAEGQRGRGGGTVCFPNTDVWHAFKEAAVQVENCKKTLYWHSMGYSNNIDMD